MSPSTSPIAKPVSSWVPLSSRSRTRRWLPSSTKLFSSRSRGRSASSARHCQFTYSNGTVEARKTFTFGSGYEIKVQPACPMGNSTSRWKWVAGGFGDQSLPPALRDASSKAVYGSPGSFTTVPEAKVKENCPSRPFGGRGTRGSLLRGCVPSRCARCCFRMDRRQWNPPEWKGKELPQPLEAALGTAQPQPLKFRLVVAPKDLDVLRAVKPPLDGLVDFGWFTMVAKPCSWPCASSTTTWHTTGAGRLLS